MSAVLGAPAVESALHAVHPTEESDRRAGLPRTTKPADAHFGAKALFSTSGQPVGWSWRKCWSPATPRCAAPRDFTEHQH